MKTSPVKIWRRQKKVAAQIGEIGTIVQWTIIRTPAKAFAQEAPYPVVIVKLANNKNVIGQLVDWQPQDLVIGKKVTTVLRRAYTEDLESVIGYTIKFKPHLTGEKF